uniref:Uncharacterized protein n=1 Tax=Mesocestoides corti TaxID=53468 RepID=A0A5K3EG75_MESCO
MSLPASVSDNVICEKENGKTTITLNITLAPGCAEDCAKKADNEEAQGGASTGATGQKQITQGEPREAGEREQLCSRSGRDPDKPLNLVSLARQRINMGCSSTKFLGVSQMYKKVDEVAEDDDIQKGIAQHVNLYCRTTSQPSRHSKMYHDNDETPLERSFKITPLAREDINKMHKILENFFDMLLTALEALPKRDFSICDEMIRQICQFQSTLVDLMEHLRYGPYKTDLEEVNTRLNVMIDELEISPPFVLLRLVEFGFNVYEVGTRLREELLPSSFAHLVHKVQGRIYRLQTGRIIRQIYYVPFDMDPVVGTYFKSRQLIKLENFCHCNIVLLPPDDPRCIYCPVDYRTIEVNFDFKKGRYLGFQHLLDQCATSKSSKSRLAASVFRRLCSTEVELSPEDFSAFDTTEARIPYVEVKQNIVAGNGLGIAPKIDV